MKASPANEQCEEGNLQEHITRCPFLGIYVHQQLPSQKNGCSFPKGPWKTRGPCHPPAAVTAAARSHLLTPRGVGRHPDSSEEVKTEGEFHGNFLNKTWCLRFPAEVFPTVFTGEETDQWGRPALSPCVPGTRLRIALFHRVGGKVSEGHTASRHIWILNLFLFISFSLSSPPKLGGGGGGEGGSF